MEARVEATAKVSGKAMEAAMVARLFKDAMESESPIVAHFVWERDDGQRLDMGKPKPHPSFPTLESALRRLEARIGQWVSGERSGVDQNALVRLEVAGNQAFDLSLESFEKAALADDGSLVVAVGFSKGVGREPMVINRAARIKLYDASGNPVGRRQALVPIREVIQINKRERQAQALRLESQERDFDEHSDVGREVAREESRQWADMDQEPAPSPAAKRDMAAALDAVEREMGPALKAPPQPPRSSAPAVDPRVAAASAALSAAFGAKIQPKPAPAPAAELPRPAPTVPVAEPAPVFVPMAEPARELPHLSPLAQAPIAAPAASVSQVRTESPSPRVGPEFVRAVFPPLPEGVDEVHIAIDKASLFDALEALEDHGEFEIRLASRGDSQLNLGVCVPAGGVAVLADFIARFSKGGVMIKRSPGKGRDVA